MHIVSDIVRNLITLDDAFIAIYVLTAIVAAEAAIISDLRKRLSRTHKLLKIASSPTTKQINDTIDKKTDA